MKEKSRGMSCSLSDFKQILRVAKIALVFSILSVSFAFAQTRRVTGTVLDPDRAPVIGAYVSEVNNGQNGAVTDVQGRFSINVTGDAMLAVSYVGYTTMEVPTAGRTNVEIVLEQSIESLDEVVVVGYGTMRKSDLTGAVASVSTKDLLQLSTTDIGQALAGRVAGVDIVSNSGQPGAGTRIRIRGYGSLNNSDPLYVVDGFAVDDISYIAPQDIESMEVLKDASSTAIYGSRGGNGVILIQTKSGGYDRKPVVSVNVYGSMSQIARNIEVLNAAEFATLKLESLRNGNSPITESMQAQFDYVIKNNLKGTNWQNELTRTGWSQNYNVGINGGGNRTAYDMGVTYTNEQAIAKYNGANTLVARMNNIYKFTEHIEFSSNLTYMNRKTTGPAGSGGGAGNDGYYGGLWNTVLKWDPLSPAWDSYTNFWGETVYTDPLTAPAQSLYEQSSRYRSNDMNNYSANLALNINKIGIEGLSFRTTYGIRGNYNNNKNFSPIYYISANQNRQRSSLSVSENRSSSWQWNGVLNYAKLFDKHSVSATLGAETQSRQNHSLNVSANDIPEEKRMWFITQTGDATSDNVNTHSSNFYTMASYFFRANYSFDNKYLFTGTIRADGSSKFAKGHKWGYFPSFSFGWNVHQENFMASTAGWLNQLKIRAGWGHVGNEASAGASDWVALMTSGYNAAFGGVQHVGAIQQAYSNENLHWEVVQTLNLGVDFGLWNNKLTGTVDYFVRTIKDMILAVPIPQYAGMWRTRMNSGKMENKGLELSLKWQERKGNFSYSISGNMSIIRNKVLDLGSDDPVYGGNVGRLEEVYSRTIEGMDMAHFFGYKTDGIFQNAAEVAAHVTPSGAPLQPNAAPGDVKFVKTSDDGLAINPSDRVYLGSSMPDVTFGLNSTFQYKNVDLAVFLQGVAGNKIANAMVVDLYSSNMTQWNMSKDMLNRWTGEGSTNKYPRVVSNDPNANSKFSDRYIENGSFVRIRNVQVGYNFSPALISRIGVERLRLYASVDNLYVFSKYRGYDPEMGNYVGNSLNVGIDMGAYPRPRVISMGLNLTF